MTLFLFLVYAMATKFRDIPFKTGADDKLAKVDVYTEKRTTAINEKSDKINENLDLADKIKNNKGFVQKKQNKLIEDLVSKHVKSTSLLGKLLRLLKGDNSIILGLLPLNIALLYKLYEDNKDRRLFKGSDGKKRKRTADQIDRYNQAIDQLDSLAPEADPYDPDADPDPVLVKDPNAIHAVDITTEVAAYTQIIKELIDLGEPDATTKAIARITDEDVKREVYTAILNDLLIQADLDNLDSLLDFLGVSYVNNKFPDLLNSLLLNFVIPETVLPADYPLLKTKLLAILTKINPNWYLTPRADTVIRNLKPYIFMSDDAKRLISLDPIHKVTCMIADSYKTETLVDLLSLHFPLTPIGVR